MTCTIQLREIAHARAGDKGDVSSIGLFVSDPEHYALVKEQVTPAVLKAHFGAVFKGTIRRYEIDHLQALNFVMASGLEGGVNRSLNLDSHGKSWSYLLLSIEIDLSEPIST
jgi:hypothetical protein